MQTDLHVGDNFNSGASLQTSQTTLHSLCIY